MVVHVLTHGYVLQDDFVYSDGPVYDINRDVSAHDTEKDDTTKGLNGDSISSITESNHVRKQSMLSSEPVSPVSCPTKELTGTSTVSISGLGFSKCRRKRWQLAFEQSTPMNLKEKYIHLYTAITSGEMLTDRHIDAASQLLSGLIFKGFQHLYLGKLCHFLCTIVLQLQLVFLTYKQFIAQHFATG